MGKVSGFCERCDIFSPFLERRGGEWLCTVCYDEVARMRMIEAPLIKVPIICR